MNVASGYLVRLRVAGAGIVRSAARGAKMHPGKSDTEHVAGLVSVNGQLARYAMNAAAGAMRQVQEDRQRLVVSSEEVRVLEHTANVQLSHLQAVQRAHGRKRRLSSRLPLRSILPLYVRSLEQDRASRGVTRGVQTKRPYPIISLRAPNTAMLSALIERCSRRRVARFQVLACCVQSLKASFGKTSCVAS